MTQPKSQQKKMDEARLRGGKAAKVRSKGRPPAEETARIVLNRLKDQDMPIPKKDLAKKHSIGIKVIELIYKAKGWDKYTRSELSALNTQNCDSKNKNYSVKQLRAAGRNLLTESWRAA